ncbi:SpoIVB peptidase [Paenibacillus yonginensis]|uniref:SpoIVB peptidase n=1 Tax=Paenibacillus yonginensis TaxID=1462996 RepID=A0A1B1N0F3_9BACL|nr:SpoIVB peptidase [Paenibacillus yonginensis]ANS74920.1 SpoIVB peptidase [Paenibacillus yonginensis]
MNRNLKQRILGLFVAFFLCLIGTTAAAKYPLLTSELRMFEGQAAQVSMDLPVQTQASVSRPGVVAMDGITSLQANVEPGHSLRLTSLTAGAADLKLKLFGKLPYKTVKVKVVPDLKVIPGGQTIGVKVKSDGILVVGHHQITESQGKISPGEIAGLKLGDLITHLNGIKLTDAKEVSPIVEKAGKSKKPLEVTFKRGNEVKTTQLTPGFDAKDKVWRLGLYIRDSAAGVGTLTFYAPKQGVYGALGHVITDMNTQTPIVVGSGQVIQSSVTSISKSENGEPGEKRAIFVKEGKQLGTIERNTNFGIFGKMDKNPDHSLYGQPVPVAFAEEVKEGPAEILTVVNGQQVERFKVEVVHVAKQHTPETKGMVIRITDPKLINKTGGIVQGMSGSPIMQNGKLIGAVTHVFVNDPKSGYGCFIEWMLKDAGISISPNTDSNLKVG